MSLEKLRRLVFVVVAVALFLATVMPSFGVSVGMADSPYTAAAASMDGMICPDCDTSPDSMAGCTQATCIGSAVMTDDGYFSVLAMRPAYAFAAVAWPDDFISAPSTPPI